MFVPLWLIFLLSGLAMAVLTVVWAIRSHQFDDPQRARYLPLVGLTPDELGAPPASRHRVERAMIWVMVFGGLASMAAALVLVLV